MSRGWSRILQLVTVNRGLKALSLLLALVCWYLIRETISFEIAIPDVPVRVRVAEGLAVREKSVQSVEVVIRGAQSDVMQIRPDTVAVIVDLKRSHRPGEYEVKLRPHMVRVPGSVRVVSLDPQRLRIAIEEKVTLEVPVEVDLTGSPALGFVVRQASADPARVKVTGPASLVKALDTVRTQPVDASGASASFRTAVKLVRPGVSDTVDIEPSQVTVAVAIAPATAHRRVEGVPVRVVLAPEVASSVRIRPPRVDIDVQGDARLLEALDADNVLAFVDCSGLKPGTRYELAVRGIVPRGMFVAGISPPTVEVKLSVR
ncbi:MAG: hypothetical protein DRP22_04345 [Verrucomicrobia bacterium]|nr:MAG: hypothetical protein DRP22_04345 [Verrucomicrobiota bacterium]